MFQPLCHIKYYTLWLPDSRLICTISLPLFTANVPIRTLGASSMEPLILSKLMILICYIVPHPLSAVKEIAFHYLLCYVINKI